MPDKKSQDWTADEQFWDEAWNDMEQQLDAHLPQRKRRAALWYWWFSGLLLLGLVLSQTLPDYFGETPEVKETPGAPSVTPSSPDQVDNTEEKPASESITELEQAISITAEPPKNSIGSIISPRDSDDKKAKAKNPAMPQPAEPIIDEKTIIAPAATQPPVLPADQVENRRATDQSVLPLATRVFTAEYSFVPEIHPPALAQSIEQQLKGKFACVSAKKTNFLLSTGISQSLNPGGGVYGGIGLQRRISNNGYLAAELSYRYQQERIVDRNNNGSASDEQGVVNTPDSLAELSFDRFITADVENNTAYIISQSLRLGISYQRQLGRKWMLSGGLGVNYIISLGLQPEPVLAGIGSPSADYRNLFNNNALVAFAQTAGSININDELDLRRWRYDAQLKVGYRIGRRWTIEAGTTTYLSSVFGKSYDTTRWRGDVGVSFRF